MATVSELKAKLAKLELSVDYVPAEFKDSILKKIEATKAEISTLEDEEEKDTEEKKTESPKQKPVEKKVVKEQVKKTAKVSTKKNSVSEAKKQIKEVKKEVKVSPQAAKRGRPRKVVEVVVPKVAKKVVAKRKTKTQIKKAELKKAETKKVVAKKPVKKAVVRKTRSQLKAEKAMTNLQRLVTKNKELKALYLNSGVDLEKDSTRSAKPFGWRLAGSNKRPTRQQIRNGDAYWEGRANRVDINNKAYPKLADGGMMDDGGMMAKGDYIYFIISNLPRDLDEKLLDESKMAGTTVGGMIGVLDAMIGKGITDKDFLYTANRMEDVDGAVAKTTENILAKIKPNCKCDFESNVYYSTVLRLVRLGNRGVDILKRYKNFRKNLKVSMADGGMMDDGGMMAKGGGTDVKSRYAIVLKDKEGEEITQYTSANNLMDATKQAKLVADIYKMSLLKVYMVDDLEDSEKNRKQGIRMMKKKGMMDDGGMMARGGSLDSDLDSFDIDNLDEFEHMLYNDYIKNMSKKDSLMVIINNVEGDYTQLSPKLRAIAKKKDKIGMMDDGGMMGNSGEMHRSHKD
jgi:hypothetical protein